MMATEWKRQRGISATRFNHARGRRRRNICITWRLVHMTLIRPTLLPLGHRGIPYRHFYILCELIIEVMIYQA